MIVWGGYDGNSYVNTGGRYNPTADSWVATSTTNAPDGRDDHTAVWTGTQMVIWGGFNASSGVLNTGGSYNPGTDGLIATSAIHAPSAPERHTCERTGKNMSA